MALLVFRRKSQSQAAMPYGRWLAELGEPLVLFTNERSADDANYAHVEYLDSFTADGLLELRALDLDERFHFTRVFAQSEHDLIRAAHLREWLGLPGQTRASIRAYRDKLAMKTAVLAGGVKVPAFAELSAPLDLVAFARSHGYPIVVKPRAEAGARGVRVLHSMADVRSWLAAPLPADFMVERYVDGAMYHVNGLAVAGRIEFCCSFRYLTDCLGYQSQRSLGACLIDPEDPIGARLSRATQETIAVLPAADQLAFHAEFFLTRDDELVFCEIAARPGGSRTAEVIEVAYGFNMYEAWARQSVGLPALVNRVQTGSAGNLMIPPRPGHLHAIPDVALDGLSERLPAGFLASRVGGARCLIRPRSHDIARSLADPLHGSGLDITNAVLASIGAVLNTDQTQIKLTPDFGRNAGLADVLLQYTPNVLGIECARGGCGGKSSYSATGVIAVVKLVEAMNPHQRITCIGSAGAMGTTILDHFRADRPAFLGACDLAYDAGTTEVPEGCVHLAAQDGRFTDECLANGGLIIATTVGDELVNSDWRKIPAGSTVLLAHNLALPVGESGIELARELAVRGVLVIPGQVLTLGGALTARVEWYWRQRPQPCPFDKPLAHDVVSTTASYLTQLMLREADAAGCTPYEALLEISARGADAS